MELEHLLETARLPTGGDAAAEAARLLAVEVSLLGVNAGIKMEVEMEIKTEAAVVEIPCPNAEPDIKREPGAAETERSEGLARAPVVRETLCARQRHLGTNIIMNTLNPRPRAVEKVVSGAPGPMDNTSGAATGPPLQRRVELEPARAVNGPVKDRAK
jgi:hypothetical protein